MVSFFAILPVMDSINRKIIDILSSPEVIGLLEQERADHNPLFSFIDEYMVGCEHVNYHKEGDVWDHTKLVIQNIINHPHDHIDVAAALLHDVGKQIALEKNNGKNMAGHELFSRDIAEGVLKSWHMSHYDTLTILWLILHHTQANDLVKCKSKYDCWLLVRHPDFDRLRKLARADSKGTLDDNGNPLIDYDSALEQSVAGQCLGLPMPLPICDIDDFDVPDDAIDDAWRLAYKIQINSNLSFDHKDSIIRSVNKTIKQQRNNHG